MSFASIPEAIEEIRAGRLWLQADDEDRENEQLTSSWPPSSRRPEAINFLATLHGRGLICLSPGSRSEVRRARISAAGFAHGTASRFRDRLHANRSMRPKASPLESRRRIERTRFMWRCIAGLVLRIWRVRAMFSRCALAKAVCWSARGADLKPRSICVALGWARFRRRDLAKS